MIVSIWSKKGGVGKTSLAFSLAKDLGLFLISNDDSLIEIVYPGKSKIMENPKLVNNTIYDFGGFVDGSIKEILDESDLIIVPITNDLNSFKKTISTLDELPPKKVIIVANRASNSDFEEIETFFKKRNFKVFEIPESKIFKKTFKTKQSVSEIVNKSKFNSYIYKNVFDKYNKLLNYIKAI